MCSFGDLGSVCGAICGTFGIVTSLGSEKVKKLWSCLPLRNSLGAFHTISSPMKITLSLSSPAAVETECLVAVVLERGEKENTDLFVSTSDKVVLQAASAIVSSGDVTAKNFETTWLHAPAGLKAKRLLLVGGGKSKVFALSDLRKLAGAAIRALKPRNLRSMAIILPDGIPAVEAARAVVEGAIVG